MTIDPDVPDENGLCHFERESWLRHYRAITDMADDAVLTSPSQPEALRRMRLLRFEMDRRIQAITAAGPWPDSLDPNAPVPATAPAPNTEKPS